MGNCCGTDEDTAKQETKQLTDGPVKKRCCTDIICIPIFILHIIAFWVVTWVGVSDGDPMKLMQPRDFRGEYCGISEQWNSEREYNHYEYQMYSMNLTKIMDPLAMSMLCDQGIGYEVLVSGLPGRTAPWSESEFLAICPDYDPSSALGSVSAAASAMSNYVGGYIEKYTNPDSYADLYPGGMANILSEITSYMNTVCVTSCGLGWDSGGKRNYSYDPDVTESWYEGWVAMRTEINSATQSDASVATLVTGMSAFDFEAWSEDDCPYDERYCVPLPGLDFEEIDFGYCMPSVDSGAFGDVATAAMSTSLGGLASWSITEEVSQDLGDGVGNVIKTWDVMIIVCVCAFVSGFVSLVLLRFLLKPFVWFCIIGIFVLILAGGIAAWVRSTQCADDSFSDSASSSSSSFDQECLGGYAVEGETSRDALKYCAYICVGLAVVYLLLILCMFCRIRIAIAVNQVAAQFLYHNPTVIFVPIVQALAMIIWIFIWAACASYLLSQVSDDYMPSGVMTYAEAHGSGDAGGQCTDMWPSGGVWKDSEDADCIASNGTTCWKCSPPRWALDERFAYSFFSYLWQSAFMVALSQCIVAGAVGAWFFAPKGDKMTTWSLGIGIKNAVLWHTGSLAFGSFILAVVQFIRWFLYWLKKQAEAQGNIVMVYVCKILGCLVWCFEKCVKFLNKNAYIQIALMGTNFCVSAKHAFWLILRNALRFGAVMALSYMVHVIGYLLITVLTGFAGYFILVAMYPDVQPTFPVICYVVIGYLVAKIFMGVFGLCVDSTLHCFIAAEEIGGNAQSFIPDAMKNLIDSQKDQDEGPQSKCCGGCCLGCC
eukprot:CAMPEP_0194476184 /NCGR_PEP_ID=MMETSP0253-20130528/101_1 /TAXON_ID=2966 /ORGANISM="Noctiluca scintillans" /LENGTH=824 /DNA_ID=CAMNT_0039315027 /DNA_START=56 /DNA_END=2530 /DNA_ORIENTATION=-